MPTLSTSLRTTLSTAAREGINLHLVKNLGVPVKVPPGAAFALLRSNPRNAVRSNSHAGKETSWLSPEHQEHGKRTVRSMMLSGICMCWSNTEQWHSKCPAAAHSWERAALGWSQDQDLTHRAWGRGNNCRSSNSAIATLKISQGP